MVKILLVDDEELVRMGLTRALRRRDGVEVLAVSSGAEAIRELCSRPYDLCILDYHLSDMDGGDILEAIRQRWPLTRVALMTASLVEGGQHDLRTRQANFFLPKPFDLAQVRAVVDQVVESLT